MTRPRLSWWPAWCRARQLAADATVGGDVVLILGPGFKGIGASVPKDTASTPTTVPVSPEEACQ